MSHQTRYFHSDKICVLYPRSKKLEFGRVQTYVVNDNNSNSSSSKNGKNGGSDRSSSPTINSPPPSPPPLPFKLSKSQERFNQTYLMGSNNGQVSTSSFHLNRNNNNNSFGGGAPPIMFKGGGSSGQNNNIINPISPVILAKKSRSLSDLNKLEEELLQDNQKLKTMIVWDDKKKGTIPVKQQLRDGVYKVVDRKFNAGQSVLKNGNKGKVVEVMPLVTMKTIEDPTSLIPDLEIDKIQPISPIFPGVTICFKNHVGLVQDVQRKITYKLEDGSLVSRYMVDSVVVRNPVKVTSSNNITPVKSSSSSKSARVTSPYPFNSELTSFVPYVGKTEKFTRGYIDQLRRDMVVEEEQDKENFVNRTSSSSRSSTSTHQLRTPKKMIMMIHHQDQEIGSRLSRKINYVDVVVENVQTAAIKVQWTGVLPPHLLITSSEESSTKLQHPFLPSRSTINYSISANKPLPKLPLPPTMIPSSQVNLVVPLYVPPAMFLDKDGAICECTVPSNQMVVQESEWSRNLYEQLCGGGSSPQFPPIKFELKNVTMGKRENDVQDTDDDDEEDGNSKKRTKLMGKSLSSSSSSLSELLATKHFTRHKYRVVWDPKKGKSYLGAEQQTGVYFGHELEPDLRQEHSVCFGNVHSHLYMVGKKGNWLDAMGWDYGVVIEKFGNDSLIIEWLRINKSNGLVDNSRILKCNLTDIDNHPKFNNFHEGRIVVRSAESDRFGWWKNNNNNNNNREQKQQPFRIGTIVRVERFSVGQIHVYCPVSHRVIEVWPHMLELFEPFSMRELIEMKSVGVNKKKF